MERPAGITVIAILFFMAAAYLLVPGLIMLLRPGTLSMMLGSPLLGGLELGGPYMFILFGAAGAAVGWGLWRLNNWARRAAVVLAVAGVALLVPSVSSAVVDFRVTTLAWGGLGVIVRVIVAWYLYQAPVVEAFTRRPQESQH
jgi:hypothetical protein